MLKKLLEEISLKVKDFDVFYESGESLPVLFENNELKNIAGSFNEGIGLRIKNNNRTGSSSTTDLKSIKNLIDNALQTSEFGEQAFFTFPDKCKKKQDLKIYSCDIEKLDVKRMVDWGNYYIDHLLKLNNKLQVNVSIQKDIVKKELINSTGLECKEDKTLLDISVSIFHAQEKNFLEIWEWSSFTRLPDEKEFKSILDNIVFYYKNSKKTRIIKNGLHKVFFTAKAFSSLMGLLIQSFNGKLFEKKVSYFCDKINKKFLNKNIDIIDNPYLEGYPYSTAFDGEGVSPEKIALIEKGIVRQFPLDMQTAGKMSKAKKKESEQTNNLKSNGHCNRSYNQLPSPGFTNIQFNTHDNDLLAGREEIIKSMKNGIIIDQLLGAGQSNIIGGEFSANVGLGFAVENGEITGRIKDCMISGNLFEFFKNILKVEDKKYSYSRFIVPGVLFDKIAVSVKS